MRNSRNNKKVPYIDFGVVAFSLAIIWILGLLFMKDNTSIKIIPDEFGYWTAGAWMSGKDWSNVAALNPYYGYGYGLLLGPILGLPISIITKYKLALLLNLLMLSAVYLIIYYLLNQIKTFDKKYISALIALTVTLYIGNMIYTQYALTENVILLGFWLFILLLHSINKKYAFYKIILGAVLLTYLYMVHMRMLSVIAAGVICLLYILIREKKYRDAIFFLTTVAVFLLGAEWIKKIYQETYLTNINVQLEVNNDYSGQVSKIKFLFSLDGIVKFLFGVMGKIFYVLSSSYLLAGIGVYRIIKELCICVKEKKVIYNGIIEVFILLSVIMSIGIATVSMIDYTARQELLIYGRYSEFFIASLILIGLITLLKSDTIDWKANLFVGILYLLSIVVVNNQLPGNVSDASGINSVAIYNMRTLYGENAYTMGLMTVIFYIISVSLIYFFKKRGQNIMMLCGCLFLAINWVTSYTFVYQVGVLSAWANETCDSEEELAEYIKSLGIENNLYYCVTDTQNIDRLQFLLEDVNINCLYNEAQLKELPTDAYLVTAGGTQFYDSTALNDFEQVKISIDIQLWKRKTEDK